MVERIPADRVREGDLVRAVEHGPTGKVIDANRAGWTIVKYRTNRWNDGCMSYRHGEDRLILVSAASREQGRTDG